ncbi:hypothetical protein HU200_020204 [Digitaria exilis]|uniref:Uncharacterized protein n=1 Tax=Digitaria exilis TaxID=1010633 RepID=A0A835KED1_9POAL|nr:hypothetical protein HU200_020204 [Digitaria exilis]
MAPPPRVLLLLLLAATALSPHICSAVDPITTYCAKNFTGAQTQSSITQVLFTLVPRASSAYYATATSGTGGSAIWGLAQCRGDIPSSDCALCISAAAKQVASACHGQADARVWYDYCFLRYDDANFIGLPDTGYELVLINTANASDPFEFDMAESKLMARVAAEAGSDKASGGGLARETARLDSATTIYGLGCEPSSSPATGVGDLGNKWYQSDGYDTGGDVVAANLRHGVEVACGRQPTTIAIATATPAAFARVVERRAKDVGGAGWPMLTKTNYGTWAAMMKLMLKGRHLWDAVDRGGGDADDDLMALEAICKGVPEEMRETMANKSSAKVAWDDLKTANLGVERVRRAKAHTLCREFDSLTFKDGESIDEFNLRIDGVIDVATVVRKFLQALPPRLHQIALSIEMLLDVEEVSVEELVGRLKAAEERHGLTGGGASIAQLNLTEDELVARLSKKMQLNSDKGSGSSSGSWGGQQRGRGGGGQKKGGEGSWDRRNHEGGRGKGGDGARGGNGDLASDQCRYCGKTGHWARECPKRRRDGLALAAQVEEESEPTLLVTAGLPLPPVAAAATQIHIDEDKLFVQLGERSDGDTARWILDTGATNHMTGARSAFAELDSGIRGTVRFGDGSTVGIEGRGTVLFQCKTGEHQKLTGVYHIPRLTANIISLGQLEEEGFKILLNQGALKIWDPEGRLVARVPRAASRLYILKVVVDKPVCLAAHTEETAWRWHARYGHLGFQGLQKLSKGEMVIGLPRIDHVNQVCDGCLVGKQRRFPFPAASKFRARQRLELVHADLCGPITPATPGGKKMFLLAVDDMSRYMWLVLLVTKDESSTAIVRLQAGAEKEAERKLGTLRTDRGGEFTARAFGDYCAGQGIQRHFTAPYTPQQNGVVERRNQTVLGMARCMLKAMGVPGRFWGEAVTTAVFILNRAPTKSLDSKTPYEAWYEKKPAVHYFRTFGCVAHVKNTGGHLKKLDDRSKAMVFLGYEPGTKAYRLYDPGADRVHVSRDVVFQEERAWDWSQGDAAGMNAYNDKIDDDPFIVEYVYMPGVAERVCSKRAPERDAAATCSIVCTRRAQDPGVRHAVEGESERNPYTNTAWRGQHAQTSCPRRVEESLTTMTSTQSEEMEVDEELLVAVGDGEPATFEEAKLEPCWLKAMKEEMLADILTKSMGQTRFSELRDKIGVVKLEASLHLLRRRELEIWATGWCTRDITAADCGLCVAQAVAEMPNYCRFRRGCRVLYSSCMARYETYPFFFPVTGGQDGAVDASSHAGEYEKVVPNIDTIPSRRHVAEMDAAVPRPAPAITTGKEVRSFPGTLFSRLPPSPPVSACASQVKAQGTGHTRRSPPPPVELASPLDPFP